MKTTHSPLRTLAVAGALSLVGTGAVQAQTWWDPQFFASGPSVTVRYIGSSAAYYDIMQWFNIPFASIVFDASGVVDYDATGSANYVNMFSNKAAVNPIGGVNGGVVSGPMAKSLTGATYTMSGLTYGTEVLLGLFTQGPLHDNWVDQDTNDFTYFSGPGRNVDNQFHLKVVANGGGFNVHVGGWEDIGHMPGFNPDDDFNDLMFEIEGVYMTPEPVTMTLLGTGLFGIGAAARRRRRKEQDS